MTKDDLKILVLQIREDEETMLEEFYEFVEFSGLREEQFTRLNTYQTATFEPTIMDGYHALFVGGSSDASVLDPREFTFIESCNRIIRHCYDHNIPVLASCFGFQVAVEELGGKVNLDKENMEMGQYAIHLTAEAENDPLLHDMPSPFWAISGHKERAYTLPPEAINLAYTERCPYHLFKIPNKPFYAFQFHPEIKLADLQSRLIRYRERYLDDEEAVQRIMDASIHDTTLANAIVSKFVDRIIMPVYAQEKTSA